MSPPVRVRQMASDEFDAMRGVSVAAFSDDPHIGHLLDALHDSWAWDDGPSFVADIGGELITYSLNAIGRRNEPLIFLEGHPAYYPRFGFRRAADLGFVAPSVRIPPDAFMVYPLPRYDEWMTGALIYPDAFWRCDAVGLRQQADIRTP